MMQHESARDTPLPLLLLDRHTRVRRHLLVRPRKIAIGVIGALRPVRCSWGPVTNELLPEGPALGSRERPRGSIEDPRDHEGR